MSEIFLKEYVWYMPQIVSLLISIVFGIYIINNKKIKNFWAFMTPIFITLIIIITGDQLGGGGIYTGMELILGLLVIGVNAIIMRTYLKFGKKA